MEAELVEEVVERRLSKKEKRIRRQNKDFGFDRPTFKSQTFKLKKVHALTDNQRRTFTAFDEGNHMFLHGLAGTGKTFISLYLTLADLMSDDCQQNKIYIVRSVVPTRDMGFLPGSKKEKEKVYEAPYMSICAELFGRADAYEVLKGKNAIEFISTSFIRGITINDAYIIVDECQNMSFQELNSIMTRVGQNCRIIFSGDISQDDLTSIRFKEETGIGDFMRIIRLLRYFSFIEFGIDDIVRSDIVKDYIIAKHALKL